MPLAAYHLSSEEEEGEEGGERQGMYGPMHQAIVQSMLAQPFRRQADLEDLVQRCRRAAHGEGGGMGRRGGEGRGFLLILPGVRFPSIGRDLHREPLSRIVGLINETLGDFDMEIRSGMDEETGESWWAMVNTGDDPLASMIASTHSTSELIFLNRLVSRVHGLINLWERRGRKESSCPSPTLTPGFPGS